MKNSSRVLLNTIILYAKIILTMGISLISVPLILHALGENDYGIYNLVAGVISMLAFLNASLSIATQRYLSVSIGQKDLANLNCIFNSSLFLHAIIASIVVIGFEIVFFFIFNGSLKIGPDRIYAAKCIYQFLVVSTFFSIISVPFTALLNAKENMLAFAIIDILDSILKLIVALVLSKVYSDKLIFYGACVAGISILSVCIYRIYVKIKYKEFSIKPLKYCNKEILKSMVGFAGWNTFGAVAMIGRNQGIAIIFNLFCGTVANAAYGIANQVNGFLSHFTATFQKAFNPQLMQSEGMNDRERLIRLSLLSSKYSVLVFSFFSIPLILEMPYILKIWLTEVPQYTLRLCQMILVLTIITQFSSGLKSSIQAVGQIKYYFLILGIIILLNLPFSYFILKLGYPLYYCIITFIILELISLIIRIVMAKKYVGLEYSSYVKNVISPTLTSIIIPLIVTLPIVICMKEGIMRLAIVSIVYCSLYCLFIWYFALDSNIKQLVVNILHLKRFNSK